MLPALVIATLLIACPLFGFPIVLIEIDLAPAPNIRRTLFKVARSLCRNPLVASPVAGGVWALTGLALPPPFERVLTLLGPTASPCALVAIGLFLQQHRERVDLDRFMVRSFLRIGLQLHLEEITGVTAEFERLGPDAPSQALSIIAPATVHFDPSYRSRRPYRA